MRGGRLCLDFVNTTNWLDDRPVDERLTGMEATRIWAERAGFVVPAPLQGGVEDLRALRAVIRTLLPPSASASDADIERLDTARRGIPPEMVRTRDGGVALVLRTTDALVRAVADSTAELLLFPDKARLKMCPGHRCGWIFLDESPNNTRSWCSMTTCGNRAKARKFQERKRQGGTAD